MDTKWTPGQHSVGSTNGTTKVGGFVTVWGGGELLSYVARPGDANLYAAAPMLAEGAQDTVEALKLLRVGLVDKAPETIEVIDAHIDELSYALARARGETA